MQLRPIKTAATHILFAALTCWCVSTFSIQVDEAERLLVYLGMGLYFIDSFLLVLEIDKG